METILYLTRHGQTEWNLQQRMQGHLNSPLARSGLQQAGWLRDRLEQTHFDAVYASSSPRALKTAQIITGERPVDIVTQDALREINMGLWEGQQVSDIEQQFPVQFDQFFHAPHLYTPTGEGESYADLYERSIPAINTIIAQHQGQQLLVVTHRITLKVIMSYFLNKQLQDIAEMADLHPTALCKITLTGDQPEVNLYGDTSHYQQ